MGLFDKQDEGKMAGIAVVAAFALILASAYAIPRSVNESNSNKSPKSNQQSDNFLKSTINPKLIISTLPNEAKIIKIDKSKSSVYFSIGDRTYIKTHNGPGLSFTTIEINPEDIIK